MRSSTSADGLSLRGLVMIGLALGATSCLHEVRPPCDRDIALGHFDHELGAIQTLAQGGQLDQAETVVKLAVAALRLRQSLRVAAPCP